MNYENIERTTAATAGTRTVTSHGGTRYEPGRCGDGRCYRDDKAWESGEGICYIPGCAFSEDPEDCMKATVYDRKAISDATAERLENLLGGPSGYNVIKIDCDIVRDFAEAVYRDCRGGDIEDRLRAISLHDLVTALKGKYYRPGTKVLVMNVTASETDTTNIRTVIRLSNINETGAETINRHGKRETVPLEGLFRMTDLKCPKCGGPLFREKYLATRDRYPLLCPECDENFFTFEADGTEPDY